MDNQHSSINKKIPILYVEFYLVCTVLFYQIYVVNVRSGNSPVVRRLNGVRASLTLAACGLFLTLLGN